MKTVHCIMITSRTLALTLGLGLSVLGGGCGNEAGTTGTSTISEEEKKRNVDTQKAMEEAAKKSTQEAAKKE